MNKPNWLKRHIAKDGDDCSACHKYLKENEPCYSNGNSCLWCEDCAEYED